MSRKRPATLTPRRMVTAVRMMRQRVTARRAFSGKRGYCSVGAVPGGETRRRYHRSHERRDRDMSPKTMALATLIALVACDASAQAIGTQDRVPNLSGLYRCVRNCAGASLARITAYGWNLLLTNELGQTTKAWIDWPGHIWVPALNEGAVYSPDGFTIQFNRGSVWVLTDPQPLPGSARY